MGKIRFFFGSLEAAQRPRTIKMRKVLGGYVTFFRITRVKTLTWRNQECDYWKSCIGFCPNHLRGWLHVKDSRSLTLVCRSIGLPQCGETPKWTNGSRDRSANIAKIIFNVGFLLNIQTSVVSRMGKWNPQWTCTRQTRRKALSTGTNQLTSYSSTI